VIGPFQRPVTGPEAQAWPLQESLSLLPEDKSHQGLQSDRASKVSEPRMRFAFFYWPETL